MVKKSRNYTYVLIALLLVFLFYSINKSMRDLKDSSTLHEEKNILLDQNKNVSANNKEELANFWDKELLLAQQIENAINYKTSENALAVLKNIEENINFNRNKAAIMFYLGDAYAFLGNKDKASEFYQLIRNRFANGNINLYIINTPRGAVKYKDYSVSIYEESLLRQAKLNNSIEILKSLTESPGLYGVYKNEKFLYGVLANRNIYRLRHAEPFFSSYEQYWRLAYAENTINAFIGQALGGGAPDQALPAVLEKKAELAKIKELVNDETQFVFKDLRTSGMLYYYIFGSADQSINIEVLDDNKNLLISNITISPAASESNF